MRTRFGCPSDDEVAEFVEGHSPPEDAARMHEHLDGCTACRALVAGAASEARTRPVRNAPRASASLLSRGALVGRYVVLDVLGAGGMGTVYAAFDPELDRRIALKLLHTEGRSPEGRGLLLREAKVLAQLNHPNVATVFDAGDFGDRLFLAMELLEGGTLREWLAAGPRSWREVVAVLAAAGEGLAAAHRAGFVHRDFKPENVLLGREGRPRVSDFGLASPAGGGVNQVGGTPEYMAPEQMTLEASDERADVFSFCVTLYEALFGARPFRAENAAGLLEAMRGGAALKDARERRIPSHLVALLESGLKADPAERPASMETVLHALRADPQRRLRRLLAAAGLAAAAAGVGVLGYGAWAARAASCSAEHLLDGVWDESRRAAMAAAFERTGLPYSAKSFAGASRMLDEYAAGWAAMRTEACAATRVRRAQPEETMALRLACLDDRRRELGALSDLLVAADRGAVDQAASAVRALMPVSECADVAGLAMPVPKPRDPAKRQPLEAALAQVAVAEALLRAGSADRALAIAVPALAQVRSVGHAPSEAWAGYIVTMTEVRLGRIKDALVHGEQVLLDAQRGRDDKKVISALEMLTIGAGYWGGRPEEGLRYNRLALATVERTGNDPKQVVSARGYRGLVLANAGRLEEALVDMRDNLSATELQYGPRHLYTIEARSNMANALVAQGRLEEGRAHFEEVVRVLEEEVGRGNPEVIPAKSNLGWVLLALGRVEEAAPIIEAVLEEDLRAFGEGSQNVAIGLINVGELRLAQRRYAEALDLERRAVAVYESFGKDHPGLCEPLSQLGLALVGLGRASEAVEPAERAMELAKKRSLPPLDLARVQMALARVLVETRRDLPRARELAISARQAFLSAAERFGGENARFAEELSKFIEERTPPALP